MRQKEAYATAQEMSDVVQQSGLIDVLIVAGTEITIGHGGDIDRVDPVGNRWHRTNYVAGVLSH